MVSGSVRVPRFIAPTAALRRVLSASPSVRSKPGDARSLQKNASQGIVDPHRSARIVAGDLPNVEVHSASKVVHNANGSLLIDAATPIREMTDLNCSREPPVGDSQFVYNA